MAYKLRVEKWEQVGGILEWQVLKPNGNRFCEHGSWAEAFACAYRWMKERKFCHER